jgi:hypothetical protein
VAIPESQFETWANQGAISTAKATADSVKNALNSFSDWPDGIEFDVYLQGSYKNDTNIRGDSDVDVVAQLNSAYYNNLNEDQKAILQLSSVSYGWLAFKTDVIRALKDNYEQSQVTEGNKAIKIKAGSGRLSADVVVCTKYRRFKTVNINDYVEGMCFWTKNENRQVINYPKLHYDNGVLKNQSSDGWYKPVVRLFKNCRGNISGDATPSYFLECLLFNVPNSNYGTSYQHTFCAIVDWLNENNFDNFICQNRQVDLFGLTPEQWNTAQAKRFVENLISLWKNW